MLKGKGYIPLTYVKIFLTTHRPLHRGDITMLPQGETSFSGLQVYLMMMISVKILASPLGNTFGHSHKLVMSVWLLSSTLPPCFLPSLPPVIFFLHHLSLLLSVFFWKLVMSTSKLGANNSRNPIIFLHAKSNGH